MVPLAIELLFVSTLWQLLDSADAQTRRLAHAKQISTTLNDVNQLVLDAAKGIAVYKFVRSPKVRDQLAAVMDRLGQNVQLLDELTLNSEQEHRAYLKMKPATQDILMLFESCM